MLLELLELHRNIDGINTQTLYIISTNYTLLYACAIRRYYKKHTPNISCKIRRDYTQKINDQIKSDPYCLALFIGFTHIQDNISFNNIPKKKYGLIQIEQLNQTQYYYQAIPLDAIKLITGSVFTIDYSFGDELVELLQRTQIVINLHYYHNCIFEVFRIFDILQNSRCNIISEKPDLACEQYLISKYFSNVYFIDTIDSDGDNINVDYLYDTVKNILLI